MSTSTLPWTSLDDVVDDIPNKESFVDKGLLPSFATFLLSATSSSSSSTLSLSENGHIRKAPGTAKRRLRDVAAKVILALRFRRHEDQQHQEAQREEEDDIDNNHHLNITIPNGPTRFFGLLNRMFSLSLASVSSSPSSSSSLLDQLLTLLHIWMITCGSSSVACQEGFNVVLSVLLSSSSSFTFSSSSSSFIIESVCNFYLAECIEKYNFTFTTKDADMIVRRLLLQHQQHQQQQHEQQEQNTSSMSALLLLQANSSYVDVSTCWSDTAKTADHFRLLLLPLFASWLITNPVQVLSSITRLSTNVVSSSVSLSSRSNDQSFPFVSFFEQLLVVGDDDDRNHHSSNSSFWKLANAILITISNDDLFDDDDDDNVEQENEEALDTVENDKSFYKTTNHRISILSLLWRKSMTMTINMSSTEIQNIFSALAEMVLSMPCSSLFKINNSFINNICNCIIIMGSSAKLSPSFVSSIHRIVSQLEFEEDCCEEEEREQKQEKLSKSLLSLFESPASRFFSYSSEVQLLSCEILSKVVAAAENEKQELTSVSSSSLIDCLCTIFSQVQSSILKKQERLNSNMNENNDVDDDEPSSSTALLIALIDNLTLLLSSCTTPQQQQFSDAAEILHRLLSFIRDFATSSSSIFDDAIQTALEQVNLILRTSSCSLLLSLILEEPELASLLLSSFTAIYFFERRTTTSSSSPSLSFRSEHFLSFIQEEAGEVFAADVFLDEAKRILHNQKINDLELSASDENHATTTTTIVVDSLISLLLEQALLCEPDGCDFDRDSSNVLSIMSIAARFPSSLSRSFQLCDKVLRRMLSSSSYANRSSQSQREIQNKNDDYDEERKSSRKTTKHHHNTTLMIEVLRYQFNKSFALASSVVSASSSSSSAFTTNTTNGDNEDLFLFETEYDVLLPVISNLLAETQQQGFFPSLVSAFGQLVVLVNKRDPYCLETLVKKRKLLFGDLASLVEFLQFRGDEQQEAIEILTKLAAITSTNEGEEKNEQLDRIENILSRIADRNHRQHHNTNDSTLSTSAINSNTKNEQQIQAKIHLSQQSIELSNEIVNQESIERMEILQEMFSSFLKKKKNNNQEEDNHTNTNTNGSAVSIVRKLRQAHHHHSHQEKYDEEIISPIRKPSSTNDEDQTATSPPNTRPATATAAEIAKNFTEKEKEQNRSSSSSSSSSSTDSEELLNEAGVNENRNDNDDNADEDQNDDEYSLLRHETIQEQRRRLRRDRYKLRKERKQHQQAIRLVDLHITNLYNLINEHCAESYHSKRFGSRVNLLEEEQRLIAAQRSKTKDTEIRTLRSLLQKRNAMLIEIDSGLELQASLQQPMKSLVVAVSEKCEKLEHEIEVLRSRLRHQEGDASALRHKTDAIRLQENDEMERKVVKLEMELEELKKKQVQSFMAAQSSPTRRPHSGTSPTRLSTRAVEVHNTILSNCNDDEQQNTHNKRQHHHSPTPRTLN